MKEKKVLDVCCGPRGMWFDKHDDRALYLDKRCEEHSNKYPSGEKRLSISPDIIGDFTDIKQPDNSFYLVVFDPPHLKTLGKQSWMAKKYGVLLPTWQLDIKAGFDECIRVLEPYGTLIFKWNENEITVSEILEAIGKQPLFGHKSGKRSNTHWMAFMKMED